MKPKDLILHFPDGRKTALLDKHQQIFYLPQRGESLDEGLDPFCIETLFERKAPIHLEFCSGNGEWICQKALEEPEKNWIALEIRLDRVRKIWSKMKNKGIANLFIVCAEAFQFSSQYLPKESVDQISINFPDPWPKKRHAKHRLIQTPFLDQMARILKSKGEVHTLTDDPSYFDQICRCFLNHVNFTPLMAHPHYTNEIENYGNSFFMNLWKEKKRSFYFSKFLKSVHI